MDLQTKLNQKQQQNISPAFLQSLQVLQMDNLELSEYINRIAIENPVLETSPPDLSSKFEEISSIKWISRYPYFRQSMSEDTDSKKYIESLSAKTDNTTLQEYLTEQIDTAALSTSLKRVISVIVYELNNNGYFEESPDVYAQRYSFDEKEVIRAISYIQRLEPAGVGARSLSEQLSLQLQRRNLNGLERTIVENYLEDMAHGLFNKIAKATKASREEIQNACDNIRSLNPRPCAKYSKRETASHITPDIIINIKNGSVDIIDLSAGRPSVHLNDFYIDMLKSSSDPEVVSYLKEKAAQAQKLINDINSRASTILKCAGNIAAKQKNFFLTESNDLLPMTYDDIAYELDVYESTVSRIVNSKYLLCSKGLFPFKYFFTKGLTSLDGSDISNKSVKYAVAELIKKEDRQNPLSDQEIADILSKRGILVARRTVAKYRTELNIPSTRARKRI